MDLKDVLAAKGRRIVTVSAKSSVADAIRSMHAEKVGAVMVPDAEGCPVGIFTERDVVRLYAEGDRDFCLRAVREAASRASTVQRWTVTRDVSRTSGVPFRAASYARTPPDCLAE